MNQIVNTKVSAADVASAMETLLPAIIEMPEQVAVLACIGMAISLQDSSLPTERMVELIKATSEYIALQIMEDGETWQ